jgi:hypothetical protein
MRKSKLPRAVAMDVALARVEEAQSFRRSWAD